MTSVSNKGRSRRALLIVWLLAMAWPLVAPNDYVLSLGVYFFLNLILIASLNMIMGWAGQVSLAHAAFYGLGAYVSGVLNTKYGISPWLGSLAAILMVAVAAGFIGLTTLRLRGPYLSMGTLGFSGILSVLFVELVPLTGGPNGLAGIAPYALFGWELDTPARFFWLAWAVSAVLMWLLLNLFASVPGRALRAIAGSEIGANTLGVDTFAYKVVAFSLSAAMAGLAGALYAHFNLFVSPETFGFAASVLLVVMVALGGAGRYWGPFFGAAIFTVVPELLRQFQDVELLVFGICMICVLLYFPGGIAGLPGHLKRRARPRDAFNVTKTTKAAAAPAGPGTSVEAVDGTAGR
ncbi:leucine/isoleucine/valine transporter permease subunit [Variovorax sp. PBS-H4]|uniref:branched-chain amino acid ABC transporter permease n=1 Tax=Variovorax sp. PBS-H4 TaxID=434008 RepID=UPI001316A06F|nr:branched-chain amino acid ABC transporter permease [Variovorax sp. PBS-H4]VTU27604.1 leucine/isoleucine/valine transporter permease subunit [Variovorax sp. PBS-H4]